MRISFKKYAMLHNCGAGEDSWESLGQQEDQTSQSEEKRVPEDEKVGWHH